MPNKYECIPECMRELNQWMVWKNVDGRKVPLCHDGSAGRSNDPTTWTDFETAVRASSSYTGLAFVLSESDNLVGVDLDDCIDDEGNWESWAAPIVAQFSAVGYGEISPSGKGVKFVTQGKKPDGSRCTNGEGVECYEKGRFWAITGDVLNAEEATEIQNGQKQIDWLCDRFLSRESVKTSASPVLIVGGHEALLKRARAYAAKAKLSEKNRNDDCFRLAGHLFSMVGDQGERLSLDQVFSIVEPWALFQGATPKDGEIFACCASASKGNGTPPQDKEAQQRLSDGSESVDISALISKAKPAVEDLSEIPFIEDWEGDFEVTYNESSRMPSELMDAPGFITRWFQFAEKTARYSQPELNFGGAISVFSAIVGRRIQDNFGTTPNMYALNIAPPGAGKDHIRSLNKRLLVSAGAEHLIGPESVGSGQGLAAAVQESPCCFIQWDEIGKFFESLKGNRIASHLIKIQEVMLSMFSSAGGRWIGNALADRSRIPSIESPSLTVLGTTTPDILQSLEKSNISDGLIPRFLMFESPGKGTLRRVNPNEEIPDQIVKLAQHWIGGGLTVNGQDTGFHALKDDPSVEPSVMVLHRTDEADDRLFQHGYDISVRNNGESALSAAVWGRANEKACKLALLFAASRRSSQIELQDADRAVKLVNWITRRMCSTSEDKIAVNETEGEVQSVINMIRAYPNGVSQSTVLRKCRWLRAGRRDEIVRDLVLSGEIQLFSAKKKTKPCIVYKAVSEG